MRSPRIVVLVAAALPTMFVMAGTANAQTPAPPAPDSLHPSGYSRPWDIAYRVGRVMTLNSYVHGPNMVVMVERHRTPTRPTYINSDCDGAINAGYGLPSRAVRKYGRKQRETSLCQTPGQYEVDPFPGAETRAYYARLNRRAMTTCRGGLARVINKGRYERPRGQRRRINLQHRYTDQCYASSDRAVLRYKCNSLNGMLRVAVYANATATITSCNRSRDPRVITSLHLVPPPPPAA